MITLNEATKLIYLARQVIIDNKGHDIKFKAKKVKRNESVKQSKGREK